MILHLTCFALCRATRTPRVITAGSSGSESQRPARLAYPGAFRPATPRICRHCKTGEPWQNSPASRFRCVISHETICSYLPINPVNLSIFIEFFRYKTRAMSEGLRIPDNPIGSPIIPALTPAPAAADADKCTSRPRGYRNRTPHRIETALRANLSGYFRPPPSRHGKCGLLRAWASSEEVELERGGGTS